MDDPLMADLMVVVDAFEKQAFTVAIRACDTRKRGCSKLEGGTLEFPGPLNHFALHSDDYIQASKAWAAVEAYVTAAEFKFDEDQRRIDEQVNEVSVPEVANDGN